MLEHRNFLVPDATFVIEMIAFIAVLFVMTRYVVPRIRERMNERQSAINDALEAAREADQRRREAESAAAVIRTEARRDASLITEQARSMRDYLLTEARHAGIEEYRWLAGRADRDLQRQAALAREQLRRQARDAAAAALQVYLGGEVDLTQVAALVDEHFEALDPTATLPAGPDHVAA